MKKYRSIGLLVIAIVFAGIAGLSSIRYLETQEQALQAKFDESINYVEIVVPRRNLSVGDVISQDTVSIREVPSAYVPDGTLFPADYEKIVGLSLKEPASAGRPILRTQLDGLTGIEKFSQLLSPGQRAITLPIDTLSSNENMIVPGDRVDIILKLSPDKASKTLSNPLVTGLLHNVIVLATGGVTIADSASAASGSYMRDYGSITVGVRTKEIQNIIAAKELGDLVFLLRNPDDDSKSKFLDVVNLLSSPEGEGVRVFSRTNAKGGVLSDSYRPIEKETKNRWTTPGNSDRVFKKYQGEFFSDQRDIVGTGAP